MLCEKAKHKPDTEIFYKAKKLTLGIAFEVLQCFFSKMTAVYYPVPIVSLKSLKLIYLLHLRLLDKISPTANAKTPANCFKFPAYYLTYNNNSTTLTLSPVSECQLDKNVPQLKMTYHLDPGVRACRAAVGQQCNLSQQSFEIQMCCCITMPCATNECLIILGGGEICTAKWELDGSLLCSAWDLKTEEQRNKMNLKVLFLAVVTFRKSN